MDEGMGGGGFVCPRCDATFDTQEELDRHMQEVHGEDMGGGSGEGMGEEGMGGGMEGATQ
jgi:hypothetical protein